MDNQLPNDPKGLWERKTYISAAVSVLLAASTALSVCAFQGDAVALDHLATVSVSHGHTAPSTGA